jgi:hypothetical protein
MFTENYKGFKYIFGFKFIRFISFITLIFIVLMTIVRYTQNNNIAESLGTASALYAVFLLNLYVFANISRIFGLISFKTVLNSRSAKKIAETDIKESVGQDKSTESKIQDLLKETEKYSAKKRSLSRIMFGLNFILSVICTFVFLVSDLEYLLFVGVFFVWMAVETAFLIPFLWDVTEFLKLKPLRSIVTLIIGLGYLGYLIISIIWSFTHPGNFNFFDLMLTLVLALYSYSMMSYRFSEFSEKKIDYSKYISLERKKAVKSMYRASEKQSWRIWNYLVMFNFIAVGYFLFVGRLNYIFEIQHGIALGNLIGYVIKVVIFPGFVILYLIRQKLKSMGKNKTSTEK